MSKTPQEVARDATRATYLSMARIAEQKASDLDKERAQHQRRANRCADEAHKMRLAAKRFLEEADSESKNGD